MSLRNADVGLHEITADIPVLRPSSATEMSQLRARGLREATLNQVIPENRERLAWIEYANGSRRINIWSRA